MGRKTSGLHIRLSPDEKQRLEEIAESYGLSMGGFVVAFSNYCARYRPNLVIEPAPKANALASASAD